MDFDIAIELQTPTNPILRFYLGFHGNQSATNQKKSGKCA